MDGQKNAEQPKEKTPKEVPQTAPPPIQPPQPPPNPDPEEDDRRNEPKKSSTISDKVMVWATCVIAAGTLVSAGAIYLQWREMVNGGSDTTAIKIAAQKQADAAQRFSDTAALINSSIGDAVGKLNSQAVAMSRLASDTEKANYNVIEADRPWMGASLSITDFESGKTPTYTVMFINSGKRPTRVTLTQTLAGFVDFKDSPQYRPYDTTPSISLVVPNQPLAASWKNEHPISDEQWKGINSGEIPFRIYAQIQYSDMRTNARYWTHLCWRYTPTHTAINGGFSNCSEYNEAK
jgi:hypothetical protein